MHTIECPVYKGKGKYSWHYTECSNGYTSETIVEDCEKCNKTGKIKIEVSPLIFERHQVETLKELKKKLSRHKDVMRRERREAASIEGYLERINVK